MIPGEILIIELEEIADSLSFPRETEGKEGEREDAASPVDKRGRGKTRWSRFKESIGGGPKCMLGRRDTGRNESHGVGNRIYRVLRSCITIPAEFTARSRALGKNRWGAPLENIGRDFEPRIRSDFRPDLLISRYFEGDRRIQSVQNIPFSIM